ELCLQLDFFFFGHSQPPNPNVALSLPSLFPGPTSPRLRRTGRETATKGGRVGRGRPGLSAHTPKNSARQYHDRPGDAARKLAARSSCPGARESFRRRAATFRSQKKF